VPELIRIGVLLAGLAGVPSDPAPAAALPAVVADVPAADPWLGADKFRHLGMSFAATTFTFAAARAAGAEAGVALQLSVPVSAAAGVGKEIHDRRRGGVFSLRDLAANAMGIAAAYFLLREVR